MAVIADSTSFRSAPYAKSLVRRLRLAPFWRWWKRELTAAMPEKLRNALERRRARPVLAFDAGTATLWRPAQTNGRLSMREVARIHLDGDPQVVASAGRNALAPIAVASGTVPKVIVALSPRASLRKTLTLPLALEEHLQQSLAYDLDRHTPFKPDELYFDAAVIDRDSARNTLRVDLAAARRAIVDTALRQAESFGARVVGVSVDPPSIASSSALNLLPPERRSSQRAWTRWDVVLLSVLLALGVLVALILPIWQKRMQAIELVQQVEQARSRATVSDALRTELERRVGDYNFALERKYAFPGTLQVLEDITRILPDDTWLTQLEVHTMRGKDAQREITLRGESANAGRLVSLLEDSKQFTQAAPRSPTTKIQPGPGEIFDVSAHVKPLPAPVPLPIEMLPPRQVARPTTPKPATPAAPPAQPAKPANASNAAPGKPEAAQAPAPTVQTRSMPARAAAPPSTPPPSPPAAQSDVDANPPGAAPAPPPDQPEAPGGEEAGG